MATIDEYSVSTVPILMHFEQTFLSLGTAFVWEHGGEYFLITNWHNVTGINPFTGKHLSKTVAEPDNLHVLFNQNTKLGDKTRKQLPLRDASSKPTWLIHKDYGKSVDVVALPFKPEDGVEPRPINKMPNMELRIEIGMDVFILGYPFGVENGLPVWKRGSIASEPQIPAGKHPLIFIDSASRPGMSGAPVIRRSWSIHQTPEGTNIGELYGTHFVGVYSGRIAPADPVDAQLGMCWQASLVEEIVSDGMADE